MNVVQAPDVIVVGAGGIGVTAGLEGSSVSSHTGAIPVTSSRRCRPTASGVADEQPSPSSVASGELLVQPDRCGLGAGLPAARSDDRSSLPRIDRAAVDARRRNGRVCRRPEPRGAAGTRRRADNDCGATAMTAHAARDRL
jgi:hypothetical protein